MKRSGFFCAASRAGFAPKTVIPTPPWARASDEKGSSTAIKSLPGYTLPPDEFGIRRRLSQGRNIARELCLSTQGIARMTGKPADLAKADLSENFEEELEIEMDEELSSGIVPDDGTRRSRLERDVYFRELFRLQHELVKLQDWVRQQGLRIVVVFEGRDSAGKGGVIKRITQRLNPRVCKVVALPAPTEREKSLWYFQRYVAHLPAAGEIVLFDRSWYNRAGVERVMGFCSKEECQEFFRSVPEFERMLVRSGVLLIKYWISITDEEQEYRFNMRISDPLKQWKLSPMDVESRRRWEDYTKAKEEMLARTHIPEAQWWVVDAVDKRKARLNCISHLLSQVAYGEITHEMPQLPDRVRNDDYVRSPVPKDMYVPEKF